MKEKRAPDYIGPEIKKGNRIMTREEVKARFDRETAENYSQRNPAWLPEFDYAFSLVPRLCSPFLSEGSKVLDLGAGTGNLSRTLLEARQDIFITLLDFSENMLKEVPKVLADFTDCYETVHGDLFSTNIKGKTYDVVISSFAIHHGRGEDEYKKLYKQIFSLLKERGAFICCDVIEGATPELSRLNEEGWRSFLKEQEYSDEMTEKILNNYKKEDTPLSMSSHMNLLSEAGFQSVDVIWKKYNFGIYMGIKKQQ